MFFSKFCNQFNSHNVEHDDGLDSTYSVTTSHLCQNPSHAHHISHHPVYRFPVADTVVEESTGGSIVTVISNSTIQMNDSTPDIILTHSESEIDVHIVDDHLSDAARSISIKSIDQMDEIVENALPSSSSPTITTALATEQTSLNNNEAGTDSIQIKSFSFEQLCNHITTLGTGYNYKPTIREKIFNCGRNRSILFVSMPLKSKQRRVKKHCVNYQAIIA